MISLTFPDGAERKFDNGTSGFDIASGISKSLAKKAVAIKLDGVLHDLAESLATGGAFEIVMRDDPDALELIRHDCAHVMAEAVQALFPGTQVTIGPTIENGFYYDFYREEPFSLEDFPKIEKKMGHIIERNERFTRRVMPRSKAKQMFADMGENFKVELIDAIPEEDDVKIYNQGDWLDLCRGPHLPSTGKVGKAFKLMKVAGAYWRGDSNREVLTRIYGTAWADQKQLDEYLVKLKEAEKRDHRRLGREMKLFHFQEEAPGSVFWHPKGWRLFTTLIDYMRRVQDKAGYVEVNSPDMMDRALWEQSGHWEKFRENMFTTQTEDDRVFAFKPMNCPGHVQIFKHGLKSYRDLPIKMAEFGKVHRYEPSGALHGLLRVRHFTQDDAHIFVTEDQLKQECLAINDLMLSIYKDFGFEDIFIKLSLRPEQRVGADALWDKAERALSEVLDEVKARSDGKVKTAINPGEGAFYGPKLEYVLRDAIGREWQCGTTQVDFNLAERLGAFYIDEKSQKRTPVLIHRAMFGSLERFLGILIENHAGHLPLWLAPLQAVICTIVSEADDYARQIGQKLQAAGLKYELDLRNEKINYKVREHSLAKVPVLIVVGRRETEEGKVSIRRLGSQNQTIMTLDEAVTTLSAEAVPPDLARKASQTTVAA